MSVIFWGSWDSNKNWLEPKTKPPLSSFTKFSLSKSVIRSVAMLTLKLNHNAEVMKPVLHTGLFSSSSCWCPIMSTTDQPFFFVVGHSNNTSHFLAWFFFFFFLLPDTRLVQQSFEASRKRNQAGCINQTCVALTPLPSSIPVMTTGFKPTTFRSWAVFATD